MPLLFRIVTAALALCAVLATAPGCEGVVLDLGAQGGSTCPEIFLDANLTNADFGTGPSADCVRFFAQTAVDLGQATFGAELDIGEACDDITTGGGRTVSASPDIRSRCDAAIFALTTAPDYTNMGPFAPIVSAPGTCTPGPKIPCGECTLSCDEAASASARASCKPPSFTIVATKSPVYPPALDVLQRNLPLILALTGERGEALQRTLDDILASQSHATSSGRLDLHGAVCMERTAALLADASTHYFAARAQARRIVNALADAK